MDLTSFVPLNIKLLDFKNEFPSRQIEKMAYFDKYFENFKNQEEWLWN